MVSLFTARVWINRKPSLSQLIRTRRRSLHICTLDLAGACCHNLNQTIPEAWPFQHQGLFSIQAVNSTATPLGFWEDLTVNSSLTYSWNSFKYSYTTSFHDNSHSQQTEPTVQCMMCTCWQSVMNWQACTPSQAHGQSVDCSADKWLLVSAVVHIASEGKGSFITVVYYTWRLLGERPWLESNPW